MIDQNKYNLVERAGNDEILLEQIITENNADNVREKSGEIMLKEPRQSV